MQFYIVDVFAEEPYSGNQLAVVRGAENLPDETLQKIALEMNYSETTFILSDEERGGGYDVRIFTPGEEIPFAGHPTLGTAYVIRNELLTGSEEAVTLNLKAGSITVTFGKFPWMRQLPPTFGGEYDPERIADALSLEGDDLDKRYPIQEVTTGLPAIIVPLKSLDALKKCRMNRGLYPEVAGKNVYMFCPEAHAAGRGGDLSARMFIDDPNVPEDPATGSAAGCLAAYLLYYRYLEADTIDVKVEQGYEMRRPSLLHLHAEEIASGEIAVSVGGKVRMVARGDLL